MSQLQRTPRAGSRFESREQYREAWDRAATVDSDVPLNLDLELCSLCSLRCPFCYWGEDKFRSEMQSNGDKDSPMTKQMMPTELALMLIDEASKIGIPAMKFHGRGDGIHHPDYSKILLYAYDRRFLDLLVNTHGMATPDKIPGLMAASKVMISLDSTVPERYGRMRVGGRFSNAVWTVHELLRQGHDNVWVRRVITQENKDEPFAENCKSIFGPKVHVSEHYAFPGRNEAFQDGSDPSQWPRKYCEYPSLRLMVLASGQVVPCCVDWRAEMIVGNVYEQSLYEIWNGEPIKKLRQQLRANEFASAICKSCTTFNAYDRKEREYVQDREAVING